MYIRIYNVYIWVWHQFMVTSAGWDGSDPHLWETMRVVTAATLCERAGGVPHNGHLTKYPKKFWNWYWGLLHNVYNQLWKLSHKTSVIWQYSSPLDNWKIGSEKVRKLKLDLTMKRNNWKLFFVEVGRWPRRGHKESCPNLNLMQHMMKMIIRMMNWWCS